MPSNIKNNLYVCVNSGHGNNKFINLNNIDAIITHDIYGTVDFHMIGGSIITLPLKEFEDPHGISSKLSEIYHMC